MVTLLAVNPETWTWGSTWAVTGLGFGIVLALLFLLVFILKLFGVIMQKIEAPKTPKAPKAPKQAPKAVSQQPIKGQEPTPEEKAAIAMALAQADNDDMAAVAYALYLSRDTKHDQPTSIIQPQARATAWNNKSYGLNNVGF